MAEAVGIAEKWAGFRKKKTTFYSGCLKTPL